MFTITNILAFVGIIAIAKYICDWCSDFYHEYLYKMYYNVKFVDFILEEKLNRVIFPFGYGIYRLTSEFYDDPKRARKLLVIQALKDACNDQWA